MMPCCFPQCQAAPSVTLDVPMCERHAIRVYRAVAAHIALADVDPSALAFDGGTPDLERSTRLGSVYFVRLGDRVKIGFSAHLRKRMEVIPHEEFLGRIPGTMRDEKNLHRRFAHLRTTGEWFKADDELLTFIENATAA
jgi:hypothetical protein